MASGEEPTVTTDDTDSFPEVEIAAAVDKILSFHRVAFERTVVLDLYYTSAVAHIPISLSVDIQSVTIESGYIHSSGPALYVRNIEKAEQRAVLSNLELFLNNHGTKKFFLSPYASEFFAPFEAKSSVSIRNGLDGVRIQLGKHFIQHTSFMQFIARLPKFYPNRIVVASGVRSYSEERQRSIKDDASEECTLWFVTDTGFSYNSEEALAHRTRESYIVLYAQFYLNNDQFNIFKERKPAWVASTTLPHTLSAAMLNVAGQHLAVRRTDHVTILDPFCGTGTTLFDAAVRFPNATVIGLDRDPMMPVMVRENASIFSLGSGDIAILESGIRRIRGALGEVIDDEKEEDLVQGAFERAAAGPLKRPEERLPDDVLRFCIARIFEEVQGLEPTKRPDVSDKFIAELADRGFSESARRLLADSGNSSLVKVTFYLIWRALLMNTSAYGPKRGLPNSSAN